MFCPVITSTLSPHGFCGSKLVAKSPLPTFPRHAPPPSEWISQIHVHDDIKCERAKRAQRGVWWTQNDQDESSTYCSIWLWEAVMTFL